MFEKYIGNEKNFEYSPISSQYVLTNKETKKFLSIGGMFGFVSGYVSQKLNGILERATPTLDEWKESALGSTTEACFAEETGRSILQRVQDFTLSDIDPQAVANCINSKYTEAVANTDWNNAYMVPILTGLVGTVAGVVVAYKVGRNIEDRYHAKTFVPSEHRL